MKVLILLLVLIITAPSYGQRTDGLDSLEFALESAEDSNEIEILLLICHQHLFTQPDTALIIANRAYDKTILLSRKYEDIQSYRYQMAEAANRVGTAHYLLGDYPNALIQWQNFLRICEELGNKTGIALAYGNIGIAYRLQGNLVKSLESILTSLRLDRELLKEAEQTVPPDTVSIVKYKNGVARHLSNIGIVYDEKGEYQTALEYYLEALNISRELNNRVSMAAMYGNIGLVFAEREDFEQALNYYFSAVEIDVELGNTYNLCAWYSNIGAAYQWEAKNIQGREALFDTSLAYYSKSLEMAEVMESQTFIAGGLNSIGGLYLEQGKYAKAIEYIQRSQKIASEIGLLMRMEENEFNLSQVYARTGAYGKALAHYKEYTMLKDSLFNEDRSKEIGKLEAKHEFDSALEEKERIEKEAAAKAVLMKSRSDNLQYSGILIFLVLLGAGVLGLGRLKISVRLAEGIIFFSFLLLFEFTLVLLDPYIEEYSAGAPAIKLMFNALLAGMIFPLHSFFEETLKNRLMN